MKKNELRIGTLCIFVCTKKQKQKLKNVLYFLESADKKIYEELTKKLKKIIVVPSKKYANTLFVEKKTWVVSSRLVNDASYSVEYLSSLLVHELCHLTQYQQGKKYYGPKAEKEAVQIQKVFLKKINFPEAVHWLDQRVKERYWELLDKDTRLNQLFEKNIEKYVKKRVA